MNTVHITGRMVKDAELRHVPSGIAVCEFSVAVELSRYNDNGTWRNKVAFVDCTIWGVQAENLVKRATKGTFIDVAGKLDQDEWEDKKTGTSRKKLTVKAYDYFIHPSKKSNAESSSRDESASDPTDEPVGSLSQPETTDIPF